jgi:hypothetical protein
MSRGTSRAPTPPHQVALTFGRLTTLHHSISRILCLVPKHKSRQRFRIAAGSHALAPLDASSPYEASNQGDDEEHDCYPK